MSNLTQKQRKAYFSELVNSIGLCEDMEKEYPSQYAELYELIQNHPEKERKLKDYVGLRIIKNLKNPRLLSLAVCRSTGEVETISWVSCIQGPESMESVLRKCFREEITDQIYKFKTGKKQCVKCKKYISYHEMDIDHTGEYSFYDLQTNYTRENPIGDIQWETFTYNDKRQPIFADREYAERWKEYHREHAVLQSLCKACHRVKTYGWEK